MSKLKYIGLDVHRASISVAVMEESGKLAMQSVIATRAASLLEFLDGLRGTLHVTFEEGTYSTWLYDVLAGHVSRVVVCNPRKNALLKKGNKSDRIDARKLAELLRGKLLSPVYHGENSTRTLQELARSYQTMTVDTTRVMSRLKAIYRGQGIPYGGKKVYTHRHRGEWLEQLKQPGLLRRAERLYNQLDALQQLRLKTGDRRDVFLHFEKSKSSIGWFRSEVLLGRPPFRGARRRDVSRSSFLTNSFDPNGRPVCVHLRRAASSDSVSTTAKNWRHVEGDQCCRQKSVVREISGSARPQCAAALDHFHACGSVTKPARTGFSSV